MSASALPVDSSRSSLVGSPFGCFLGFFFIPECLLVFIPDSGNPGRDEASNLGSWEGRSDIGRRRPGTLLAEVLAVSWKVYMPEVYVGTLNNPDPLWDPCQEFCLPVCSHALSQPFVHRLVTKAPT